MSYLTVLKAGIQFPSGCSTIKGDSSENSVKKVLGVALCRDETGHWEFTFELSKFRGLGKREMTPAD